jgi:monovalent cation/proton antiporter MnhG/PhaG subunit
VTVHDLRPALSIVLLILGVGVEVICCIGVLVMEGAYDKLHYTGPAASVGAFLIASSIIARESMDQAGLKALLCAAILIVANPVVTHATGRALHVRRADRIEPGRDLAQANGDGSA